MKITYLFLLCAAMMFVSCGKTTKRKIAGNWKITSYQFESSSVNADGDTTTSQTTMDETSLVTNTQNLAGSGSTTTKTAVVHVNEFTIEKDGSWKWTRDYAYNNADSSILNVKYEQSGVWNFIGKNRADNFGKNERIIFNILKVDQYTSKEKDGVILSEYSSQMSYLTGQENMVFTIKESKKYELQMETESTQLYEQTSLGAQSHSSKMSLILKEKK